MPLLDSNILIYASKPEYPDLMEWLTVPEAAISGVSIPEVLGYSLLSEEDVRLCQDLLAHLHIFPVSLEVLYRAAHIRRAHASKLGDSLIAATALNHRLPLITRNEKDFRSITGLEIINPFKD